MFVGPVKFVLARSPCMLTKPILKNGSLVTVASVSLTSNEARGTCTVRMFKPNLYCTLNVGPQ